MNGLGMMHRGGPDSPCAKQGYDILPRGDWAHFASGTLIRVAVDSPAKGLRRARTMLGPGETIAACPACYGGAQHGERA